MTKIIDGMAQPDIVAWKEIDGELRFRFVFVETAESMEENREALKEFADWYYNHPDLVNQYIEDAIL